MRSVLTYLLGPFIALLPRGRAKPVAERLGIHLPRAAAVSGIAEFALSAFSLPVWFLVYGARFTEATMGAYMKTHPQNPKDMVFSSYGSSIFLILAFATHPLTLALIYFSVEGLLRGLAALLAEDQVGTLPLVLVDSVVRKVGGRARRWQEGPPIPDLVARGEEKDRWHLRIESCRPRRWDKMTTIRHEDSLYELAAKVEGLPPRPFIYILRRLPPGKVARAIYDYSPEEVLRPEFEKSQTWKM